MQNFTFLISLLTCGVLGNLQGSFFIKYVSYISPMRYMSEIVYRRLVF